MRYQFLHFTPAGKCRVFDSRIGKERVITKKQMLDDLFTDRLFDDIQ